MNTSIVCNDQNPYPCFQITVTTLLDHTLQYFTTTTPPIARQTASELILKNIGIVRLIAEPAVLIMVLVQIGVEISDIRSIGKKRWWQVLLNPYDSECFVHFNETVNKFQKSFPAKIGYKISFIFVLLIVPIRLMCCFSADFLLLDNVLSVMTVLFTGVHFLFYCRALKFIGPFVLMIYTILSRDLSRFFLIYAIFLIGFSQGFYIIFMSCTRAKAESEGVAISRVDNILDNPAESIMRMFIMTIGEFMVFYRDLNSCQEVLMRNIGKDMAQLSNTKDLSAGKLRALTSSYANNNNGAVMNTQEQKKNN
ncbi:unnamed protein product [Anisakis simplex]|uniref:Nanchung (inferred by orthology to a D. melanogaster protein) n=1 Tax=Anisakis simplex TaxID=6269 RepID=A0A0M3K9E2_ANISI|nr:unnamed protein product [Anisakis simplex]